MSKQLIEIAGNVVQGEHVKDGHYWASKSKSRNPRLLGKYWVYVAFLVDNCNEDMGIKNKDLMHDYLKVQCGHCFIAKVNGNIIKVSKSINFERCTEDEMREFMSNALDEGSNILGMEVPEQIVNKLVQFF